MKRTLLVLTALLLAIIGPVLPASAHDGDHDDYGCVDVELENWDYQDDGYEGYDLEIYRPRCVTPGTPSTTSPTCQDLLAGAIIIPDVEHVGYKIDGEKVEPGTHPFGPGTHLVEAFARRGYAFPNGTLHQWELTIHEVGDCTGPPGAPGQPGPPGAPGASGAPGQTVTVIRDAPPAPVVIGRPTTTG